MSEGAQRQLIQSHDLPQERRQNPEEFDRRPAKTAEAPEQTIEYIAELTEQLESLASSINEESLAYFLSMARAEAELVALRVTARPLSK